MEYYMPDPNPNPNFNRRKLATILAIIIIATVFYMLFSCTPNTTQQVVLPKETSLVKAGDKLIVDIVTDKEIVLTYDNHYCDWIDCPHQGEYMDQHKFISKWDGGYEKLTDSWSIELVHFMNPEWTYEQCEEYVMSGVE